MAEAKYVVRLVDQASQAARSAETAVRGVQEALGRLSSATGTADTTFAGWGNTVVGVVGNVVRAAGEIGIAFARNVVEVASWRESSLSALETVLGSAEQAGRAYRNALSIANQTPLDTRDVVDLQTRLAVSGFSEREMSPLLAATTDVGSAFGAQAAESFGVAISQIRAAGRLQGQDLNQLSNAGLNRGAILDSIARQHNLHGANETATRGLAQHAITGGRVTGDEAILAALDAVRGRLDRGGDLGSFALRQSQTLAGALSNVRNAGFNLLASMDLANSPGLVAFRRTILDLTALLSPDAPLGRRIIGFVDHVSKSFADAFGDVDATKLLSQLGPLVSGMEALVDAAIQFGKGFGPGFMSVMQPTLELLRELSTQSKDGGSSMQTLGQAVGWFAAAMILGVGVTVGALYLLGQVLYWIGYVIAYPFIQAWQGLVMLWNGFATAAHWLGENVVLGIANGITSGIHWIADAATSVGDAAIGAVRGVLRIHSPSQVFAQLGAYSAEGFALGLEGGGERVERAVSALVAVPAAGGGRGGRLGNGAVVHVTVNVERGDGDDVESLADRIASRVADVFEGWSLAGATP